MLEDVFKTISKDVVLSIEIKDSDIPQASTLTVDLIKKYDRFATTVIGAEKGSVNNWIGGLDERVCLWCDQWTGMKICLGHLTGLLPFLKERMRLLIF